MSISKLIGLQFSKLQYLERNHISLSWFLCGSSVLVELEFGDVGFCRGRETVEPGEKPWNKARTNYKLNPPMTPGWNQTQATQVGGKRPRHGAIPAPCKRKMAGTNSNLGVHLRYVHLV